ncbi:hypothetical protein HID58_018738 [Brassica napus]|uniref:Uncharacterized protein n=1 Tax=Brassica napus TaxID=3708 RepID=A0ABQ8DBX6_BRANA|nr:hypothetical protein HID58_018738 [Brassica napus]
MMTCNEYRGSEKLEIGIPKAELGEMKLEDRSNLRFNLNGMQHRKERRDGDESEADIQRRKTQLRGCLRVLSLTFIPTKEKKSIVESHIAAAVANPSSPIRTAGLALHCCDLPLLQHELASVLIDKIWSRCLSNSIYQELLLLVTCLLRRLSPP